MRSIWSILTKKNYILIYGIEEFTREDGEPGRRFSWSRRTDYSTESDFYTMKAAMCSQFGMQIMDKNAKIGDYLPAGFEWDYDINNESLKANGWIYREKSPFTGKPEWVHSEYIDKVLHIPCYRFYLTAPETGTTEWNVSWQGQTSGKVADMKELNEFVNFFSKAIEK